MEIICFRFIGSGQRHNLRSYSRSCLRNFGTFVHQSRECNVKKSKALGSACIQVGRSSPSQLCRQQLNADRIRQQWGPVCRTFATSFPKGRLFRVGVAYQREFLHHTPATPCVNNFHTSGPLRALPIPLLLLLLKPVRRLATIIVGRTIRKWWGSLPASRREMLKQALWERRWYFASGGAVLLAALSLFIFTHLDESPVTGRTRLLVFSRDSFMDLANATSEDYMEEYKDSFLPSEDPRHKKVEMVVNLLAQRNQDIEEVAGVSWTVHVVESPSINAFVLPNGNVFIFTGMLEAVADEHQLTFILGHEMAHAIIGHSAEQASVAQMFELLSLLLLTAIWAVCPQDSLAALAHWVQGKLEQVMFHQPYSRKLEAEADKVGLQLAAKACADVRAGPVFWQQMEISDQLRGDPVVPEWLSTHPSHRNRTTKLDRLVPEALELRESCGCPDLTGPDPRTVFSKSVKLLLDSAKVKGKERSRQPLGGLVALPPPPTTALAHPGPEPPLAGGLEAPASLPQALVSQQAELPPPVKLLEDPKTS